MDISYESQKSSVVNEVLRIVDNSDYEVENEFQAFDHFIADLFSNADEEQMTTLTDGKDDQGIDFYTMVDGTYEIYQCKFALLARITESEQPIVFDRDGVEDIERAYKYLSRITDVKNASKAVKHLRAQLDDDTIVVYNLVIFGELSSSASDQFSSLIKEYKSDRVSFKLISWKEITKELKRRVEIRTDDISYRFRVNDKQLIGKNDYCYFLAHASDLYNIFQEYGWSLFDSNVRYEQRNSPVNKSIIGSLTYEKSMKSFHHLNNGILIICKSYSYDKKNIDYINADGIQIINGCQTVRSIGRAYEDDICSDDNKNKVFKERCLVQVKLIKKSSQPAGLLDDIIISTNKQNKMSARNLRSNLKEQLHIKSLFKSLLNRWFYQRKDGEFNSLKEIKKLGSTKQFKIRDYKDSKKTSVRLIDNNDLAKAWASHIGLANQIAMKTKIFENDKMYQAIFSAKPKNELWNILLNETKTVEIQDLLFNYSEFPKAEEYLLSYLIFKFVDSFTPSTRENRRSALKKKNMTSEPKEKQDSYLLQEKEYMVNGMIINSKEVFSEMFSIILYKKYGHLRDRYRLLLAHPSIEPLYRNPDYKSYAVNMNKDEENILWKIYEFVKYVYKQCYLEVKNEYLSAPRRKAYLSNRRFINKLKTLLFEQDCDSRELNRKWKKEGSTFIESLPDI